MKTILLTGNLLFKDQIKELEVNNNKIIAIFTSPPNLVKLEGYIYTEKYAKSNNIPLFKDVNINSEESIKLLKELSPDLMLSFGFMQILSKQVFSIPKLGCINIHTSFLPRYRGRHPINYPIINGEKETGITMHFIDKGVDTGEIICQGKVKIFEFDTCVTLDHKLRCKGAELIRELMFYIKKGTIPRKPQDKSKNYITRKGSKKWKIEWSKSAVEIYNLIRGVTYPWPGAHTIFRNKEIIILESKLYHKNLSLSNGKINGINPEGILVSTGKGDIVVTKIKENNNFISGIDFFKKYNITKNEFFETIKNDK